MVAAFYFYTIVSSNEGGQENETLEMDETTQKTEKHCNQPDLEKTEFGLQVLQQTQEFFLIY